MKTQDYESTLKKFCDIAKNKKRNETMTALIIDSPWLPTYAGVDTMDFFFDAQTWLSAYSKALNDLPGVAFVPGTWAEFGMATEPSGWGVKVQWSRTSPPSVWHYAGDMNSIIDSDTPDPEKDGLMPAVLRQYERTKPALASMGLSPRMAAVRGPLAIASHLTGVTELLMATQLEPEKCTKLLDKMADFCIRWLQCQLARMDNPLGVLVLDDVVGMLGPADAEKFAFPLLKKIFASFPDLIHIYHNDTPNMGILEGLGGIGMDVFNFSHHTDIAKAREKLGPNVVLMGNIPPLDVLVRGTVEDVKSATEDMLKKAFEFGPVLISPGGGVSPGTPIENLQAMAEVVKRGI